MVPYDSDSSGDEDAGFTTTNVVLGYASTEACGDEVSHVGGQPSWLDNNRLPSGDMVRCKVCNNCLSLLLQLNADLAQHFPHDSRRLQVWCCKNKTCARKQGSVRVIREVKKPQASKRRNPQEPVSTPQKPAMNLGNTLFGAGVMPANSNANPFAAQTSQTSSSVNPFSALPDLSTLAAKPPQQPAPEVQPPTESFAEKLKLNADPVVPSTKTESWPDSTAFPEPFPFFYLDASSEELDSAPVVVPESSTSRAQYDVEDSASTSNVKDAFESDLDKAFQKFSDVIAQNPEQILRYEFKGQPLLYSGADAVSSRFVVPHGKAGAIKGLPRCETCGSQRVFELQLTPYLIFEIEKDDAIDIDSGMEWGTIIVGTCANNCGEDGTISFRNEWVGVQWEERVMRK